MNPRLKYYHLTILVIILLTHNCMNKKQREKSAEKDVIVEVVSTSVHKMDPEKLKKAAIVGDLKAYKMLGMYYNGKKMDEDFLSISKMMYEKYNQSIALNSIYMAYVYKYNQDVGFLKGNLAELFKNVPPDEQNEALKYLRKGVELGEYSCIEDLSDYYLSIGEPEKSKELLDLEDRLIEEHKQKVDDSLGRIAK